MSELRKIDMGDGCEIAVRIDDFTLPWDCKAPVVMLHGLAESGEAFRRWVPYFADKHPIIRPDLRGFGSSTPTAGEYEYRFAGLGEDIIHIMDALDIERFYLIGGKIGGAISLHMAATYPDRIIAVAGIAAPASLRSFEDRAPGWRKQIATEGVAPWVQETTGFRLGTSLPPEAIAWWVAFMSRTAPSTLEAFLRMVPTVDVTAELPAIACPTVIVTTTGSALGDVDAVRKWQETIPGSTLAVVESDSYHVAATHPDDCAKITRAFFDSLA